MDINLTHRGLNKKPAMSETTFSNAIAGMKNAVFNSNFIKVFCNGQHGQFCSKTCLVDLGKIAQTLQRECSFSSEKSNELTDQQDMFCFNHASAFYTSNSAVKNVDI